MVKIICCVLQQCGGCSGCHVHTELVRGRRVCGYMCAYTFAYITNPALMLGKLECFK